MKLIKKYFLFSSLAVNLLISNFVFAASGVSNGFDYPVGAPDHVDYYDAQNFGQPNPDWGGNHLGEDWNKKCGGDCDTGVPIYSISNGIVRYSKYSGLAWGQVVILEHTLADGSKYYSQYGHLSESGFVNEGKIVKRGEILGYMRGGVNLSRFYMYAHLHFEIRLDTNPLKIKPGPGYSYNTSGWIDPSDFIDANRPLKSEPIILSVTETKYDSTKLNWNKPTFAGFDHYELYRATEKDGTFDPSKRTDLLNGKLEARNIETASFADSGLNPNTDYFYSLCAFNATGLSVCSEETTTKTTTGLQNITDNPYNQSNPNIKGKYITYHGPRPAGGKTSPDLYLYDTQENKTVVQNVSITTSAFPNEPQIYEDKVVYYARNKNYADYGDMNIYYYDVSKDGLVGFPITEAQGNQMRPRIYKNYVVWEDQSKMASSKDVDIYYIDLNDGASGPKALVTGAGLQWLPEIWEGKVAYVNGTVGFPTMDRIEIIDIATKQKTFIPGTYRNARPTIDAGKVTWSDDTTKKTYVYDIVSGSLETLNIYSLRTIIREDKIVYQAYTTSALGELHIYDLSARTDRTVVSDLAYLSYFDYYQGILVYMNRGPSDSLGYSDIFILRL